jgi:pSer/pThr/pTyr-binding forkhead associated (FHA) protein
MVRGRAAGAAVMHRRAWLREAAMVCLQGAPRLVVLAPDSGRARRIELRQDYMVVGRTPGCEVRFNDPHVSRAHAALQRRGDAVYVEDLGSSGGTFIGGTAVTRARELRPGDVVTFATVAARFETASADGEDSIAVPSRRVAAAPGKAPPRETATARNRALWLSWIGFLVFGEGLTIIGATDLSLLRGGGLAYRPFGPDIAGLPGAVLGWVLAVVGILLVAAGIHIGAAASRRRAG